MFDEEHLIANETNEFDLKIEINRLRQAIVEIWIDSEPLQEPHAICLWSLAASCYQSGNFEIYTCGCGFAGCAGIEEAVTVSHRGERIEWSLRTPQSKDGFKDEQDWRERSKLLHFSFDRAQYIDEIRSEIFFADFNHSKNIEYGPEGFERKSLSRIAKSLARGLARQSRKSLVKAARTRGTGRADRNARNGLLPRSLARVEPNKPDHAMASNKPLL
jgi:hypothetical protein